MPRNDTTLVLLGLGTVVAWLWTRQQETGSTAYSGIEANYPEYPNNVISNEALLLNTQDMQTSPAMIDMLKRAEGGPRLTRYTINDGGYTWGYGHYSTRPDALPYQITLEQAESLFLDDVVNRGEVLVKQYVTALLSQNQFDALVSIAYNMSPRSFSKFAASVNAGLGIDQIAQQSVAWVDASNRNGIQNRRDREVALFNQGIYA